MSKKTSSNDPRTSQRQSRTNWGKKKKKKTAGYKVMFMCPRCFAVWIMFEDPSILMCPICRNTDRKELLGSKIVLKD